MNKAAYSVTEPLKCLMARILPAHADVSYEVLA
jgi:hypothetical protein